MQISAFIGVMLIYGVAQFLLSTRAHSAWVKWLPAGISLAGLVGTCIAAALIRPILVLFAVFFGGGLLGAGIGFGLTKVIHTR